MPTERPFWVIWRVGGREPPGSYGPGNPERNHQRPGRLVHFAQLDPTLHGWLGRCSRSPRIRSSNASPQRQRQCITPARTARREGVPGLPCVCRQTIHQRGPVSGHPCPESERGRAPPRPRSTPLIAGGRLCPSYRLNRPRENHSGRAVHLQRGAVSGAGQAPALVLTENERPPPPLRPSPGGTVGPHAGCSSGPNGASRTLFRHGFAGCRLA